MIILKLGFSFKGSRDFLSPNVTFSQLDNSKVSVLQIPWIIDNCLVNSGSVMASSAAPADLQARVSPSAEAEHFVYFSLT